MAKSDERVISIHISRSHFVTADGKIVEGMRGVADINGVPFEANCLGFHVNDMESIASALIREVYKDRDIL